MSEAAGVLLVGAEDEENLAIRSLGAFLRRAGVGAWIAGFSHRGHTADVWRAVVRRRPAMLAVSIPFQCRAEELFRLIAEVRRHGFAGHVVVGGHFPTFEFRAILESQPAIDSVMRFEGEHGIVQLAWAVEQGTGLGKVPNLVHRAGGEIRENPCGREFMDLDSLPAPLRNRRAPRRLGVRFASLISSRGCWHSSCIYCCIGAFHGGKVHKFALRSAGSVAEEIAQLHRVQGATLLQFHDDNFVLDTPARTCARIDEIARALRARGVALERLAFLIKARPDVVDAPVAAALRELGCVGVFLGVENATVSGLRALARGGELAGVERAIDVLVGAGMVVTYNLLMFHPHATAEEITANIAFARARAGLPFDFGRAEIVAGSPLERLVIRENLRCGRWPTWDYRLVDPVARRMFELTRVTFRAPGVPYGSLMHGLIALSYQAATVRRLHTGPSAEAIGREVRALVVQANHLVLDAAEQALGAARRQEGEAPAGEAVASLRQYLVEHCSASLRRVTRLKQEMLRLQAAERVFAGLRIRSMAQLVPWVPPLLGVRSGGMKMRELEVTA